MSTWFYQTAGFAGRLIDGAIDADQICLMCGSLVPLDFLSVHRASCALPVPFDVREYSSRLNVRFRNIEPLSS